VNSFTAIGIGILVVFVGGGIGLMVYLKKTQQWKQPKRFKR
jgi:hypothetical protein